MVDPDEEAMTLQARSVANGFSYGSQNINTASAAQDATVTNIGNLSLTFSQIASPTGFNTSGADTTCSTESSLGLGASCILGVVFDPPSADSYQKEQKLTDNSFEPPQGSPQAIPVTGTGVAPLTSTSIFASGFADNGVCGANGDANGDDHADADRNPR